MTKCRKVYIPLRNNRIFDYGDSPGEYEFVSVFREKQRAESVVKERGQTYSYDKSEKANVIRKVGSFYLVPASLIE
ncbi:MAG: hypothetical protein INR73_18030 [Williamsia sp.]|nr:hypothetical protein [Williamsia sp.]